MLAKVYTAAIVGIETLLVEVEVDVHMQGLPGWSMVGLLETAVKEARERVTSALRNSGYKLLNRKTIVNLAPANIKKSGTHFDLPIAIGMLCAWGACKLHQEKRYLLAGELSLTGKLLPIPGALLLAIAAHEQKLDGIIVPLENEHEAKVIKGLQVMALASLAEVVEFLNSGTLPARTELKKYKAAHAVSATDFADVCGQLAAKRALEVAAAGSHNVLFIGPPGSGKTMLAERLPSILPPLSEKEKLESMKMLSLHGLLKNSDMRHLERPFRAPHHSASYAGLIGGGSGTPKLGEISLAHRGVLFLDEIAEFRKDVLEVLRQPLESRVVHIVRTGGKFTYPADFLLIAAGNPCKCGFYMHPKKPCICTLAGISQYRRKLSGPLLDRIDIHLEIEPVDHASLWRKNSGESSAVIRERVVRARLRQAKRFHSNEMTNAHIQAKDIQFFCPLNQKMESLLQHAAEKLSLSARALHRIIKLARTIADLAEEENIAEPHIAEAITYRASEEPMYS